MKKRAILISTIWILMAGNIALWAWNSNRYDWINEFWQNTTTAVGWVKTIWTNETSTSWSATLLDTIQRAINRVLWMLSFVALILCIRWGFQMLTAAWDDWKVKSGTKILKNAAIWLAVIWLSWLVVSFVFRIINRTTGTTTS